MISISDSEVCGYCVKKGYPSNLELIPKSFCSIRFTPPRDRVSVLRVQLVFKEHSHRQIIELVRMVSICSVHAITTFDVLQDGSHILDYGEKLEVDGSRVPQRPLREPQGGHLWRERREPFFLRPFAWME